MELLGGSFSVLGGAGQGRAGQVEGSGRPQNAAPSRRSRPGLIPHWGSAASPSGDGLRVRLGLRREAVRPLVPGPGQGQPILAPLQLGPSVPASLLRSPSHHHSPPLTHRQRSALRRDPWVEECLPGRLITIPPNRHLGPHGPTDASQLTS